MNIIKDILLIPYNFLMLTWKGFYFIISAITKGFYSYLEVVFYILKGFFNKKTIFTNLYANVKRRSKQPLRFLLIICIISLLPLIYTIIISNIDFKNNTLDKRKELNSNTEVENAYIDLYQKYSTYQKEDIDIKKLKSSNSDTVAWLYIRNTNINYPVVKTNNNTFYLNHYFDKTNNNSGWIFMDYRNNSKELSTNTIIYGKELENQESFGDISYIFGDDYEKLPNNEIVLTTEKEIYKFKVFSVYIAKNTVSITPSFKSSELYQRFIKNVLSKSIRDYGVDIDIDDKILSLVTVGDKESQKVIHAKLIKDDDNISKDNSQE